MVKYIFSLLFFVFISAFAFAEKVTFYTGVRPGTTLENPLVNYDPYIPLAYIRSGGSCNVSSISKIESQNIWCMTLIVDASDKTAAFPVKYEYYLKPGEVIYMRRVAKPMNICKLKVVSVDWNKAVFEIID